MVQAGYSGTPLVRKLGIRPGDRVQFPGAPAAVAETIAPLPEGVRVLRRTAPPLDLVVCFVRRRRDLDRRFLPLARALRADGSLWVAWPKRASGVPTDLTEDVVRAFGLARGMVDTKVCAIDGTWSGLRLVVRREHRAEHPALVERLHAEAAGGAVRP